MREAGSNFEPRAVLNYAWNHLKRHPLRYTFGAIFLYLMTYSCQNPADFDCSADLSMTGRFYDGDALLVVPARIAEMLLSEDVGDFLDQGPAVGREVSIHADGTQVLASFDQDGEASFSYLPTIEGDIFGSGTSATLHGKRFTKNTMLAVVSGINGFSGAIEERQIELACDQENRISVLMPPETFMR